MSEKTEDKEEVGKIVEVIKREDDGPSSPKRVKVGEKNDFKKVTKDTLISKFQEQDGYVDYLEEKLKQCSNNGELTSLRESEEKLKLQQQESTRRENVLVMRLATKEQEMQELLVSYLHGTLPLYNQALACA